MPTLNRYQRFQLAYMGGVVFFVITAATTHSDIARGASAVAAFACLLTAEFTGPRLAEQEDPAFVDERRKTVEAKSKALAFQITRLVVIGALIIEGLRHPNDHHNSALFGFFMLVMALPVATYVWFDRKS